MQLFMGIPVTPSAAVSDFSRRKYLRFILICRKNRPLSSIQFITDEKFIGSVVDTGAVNSLLAMSLTMANNLLVVSLTPAIAFFLGVVDTGQK